MQTHFHTDANYHLPIGQGQEKKESFQAVLCVTSSSSRAALFPILAYDIQILRPT